jgi:polysaccharide export outer membrane protein
MIKKQTLASSFLLFTSSIICLSAQDSRGLKGIETAQQPPANQISPTGAGATGEGDYVLGPWDQISLSVPGLEDDYTDKVFRIDGAGDVSVPLIGHLHAAGETTAELERQLQSNLQPILKDPQVVVTLQSFGSEPVSVLGAVRNPGIVQLQGHKSLFEVLSLAGGLQPEAGYAAQVSRPLKNGSIPLPNAQIDQSANVSVATIKLKDIINAPKATQNIQILAGDTVSVPKAGIVYAVGSVMKPGGFTLNESESLSALQVLSLSEGLQPSAAAAKARILRPVPGTATRTEISVDLSRLSAGKAPDVQLLPDDILFVPSSLAKRAGFRTLDAIVNAATYASVYAR